MSYSPFVGTASLHKLHVTEVFDETISEQVFKSQTDVAKSTSALATALNSISQQYMALQIDLCSHGSSIFWLLKKLVDSGESSSARMHVDPGHTLLDAISKQIKLIYSIKVKCRTLEIESATQELGATARSIDQQIFANTLSDTFDDLCVDSGWIDCMKVWVANLIEAAKEARRQLSESTFDYDTVGDSSWKGEVTEASDLKVVLQQASTTIATLKGSMVKTHVEALKKAWCVWAIS